MNLTHVVAPGALLLALLPSISSAQTGHSVFAMTNDAQKNEVVAYQLDNNGGGIDSRSYATNGRGSGGTVDPLASQGSLTLTADGQWLFAANAGSGTVSAFAVQGSRLSLTDQVASGGSEPNSIAVSGRLLYVLNTAGASNVVGFLFEGGHFNKIPSSLRYLSGTAIGSGSVAFSADGRWLAVTEKATPAIDIFQVNSDGTLSKSVINKNVGPGTFSASFAPNGTLLVAETGVADVTNGSAISSYHVQPDGTLSVITASVPTLGAASCWEITVNGKFVYTANAGTSTVSGYTLGSNGALTPLPGTIVASNAAGATNIDMAATNDGKFLYTLNAATGTVAEFSIDPTSGHLTLVGVGGQLPANAGINGIAAN